MIAVEEEMLDKITATFHHLRTGKVPHPIPIPDDLPDNEVRQVLTYVNRFLVEFALFTESMAQIAQGELDVRPMAGKMAVVHSFKALQSNLKHLTWKTQQIAAGDLEQQVDFMGDFSIAFNTMTQQLKDSREQLVDLNQAARASQSVHPGDLRPLHQRRHRGGAPRHARRAQAGWREARGYLTDVRSAGVHRPGGAA